MNIRNMGGETPKAEAERVTIGQHYVPNHDRLASDLDKVPMDAGREVRNILIIHQNPVWGVALGALGVGRDDEFACCGKAHGFASVLRYGANGAFMWKQKCGALPHWSASERCPFAGLLFRALST